MTTFLCCSCGQKLKGKAEWTGKKTKCPACGQTTELIPRPPKKEQQPEDRNEKGVENLLPERTEGACAQKAPEASFVLRNRSWFALLSFFVVALLVASLGGSLW